MARAGEDDLIARYFAPLATAPGAAGLSDDAATLPFPMGERVVTVDAVVAGVHFFADDPPAAIAAKALRVNLSDLAAKGAKPVGFLLTLALPPDWDEGFLGAFAAGLGEESARFSCPLLGGDTVMTPGPLTLSITAFGDADPRIVRRSGARAGDLLCVTGTIGDGALGLLARVAQREPETAPGWSLALPPRERDLLIARYLRPEPRLALAETIARHASAAMDISDGFVGDAVKLLHASGLRARVELADVPRSGAASAAIARDASLAERALTGGDDYEVLFACAPEHFPVFAAAGRAAGFPVSKLGKLETPDMRRPPGLTLVDAQGRAKAFASQRFEHFR